MPRRIRRRDNKDFWHSLGKLAGVVGSGSGAVLGQAELVGEPTRHYVTIICIAALGVCAFLMGPEHIKLLMGRTNKLK